MKTLLILLSVFALTACSLQQAKEVSAITAGTIVASSDVDKLQNEVGQYSLNQNTLKKLDLLQHDINTALQGGVTLLDVQTFYSRSVNIYHVLHKEVIDRQDELTADQITQFDKLNTELLALNARVLAFNDNSENAEFIDTSKYLLNTLSSAFTIFRIYNGVY